MASLPRVCLPEPRDGSTLSCSILVAGGSTAAYSATLAALRMNVDVCLVQPLKMVGGQFTAQGLPASDDGDLLTQEVSFSTVDGERFAISKSQRWFRQRQRLLQPVAGRFQQNPGGAWVCLMTTTPVVAAIALNEPLIPYLESGKLRLIPDSDPTEVMVAAEDEQRATAGEGGKVSRSHHRPSVHRYCPCHPRSDRLWRLTGASRFALAGGAGVTP